MLPLIGWNAEGIPCCTHSLGSKVREKEESTHTHAQLGHFLLFMRVPVHTHTHTLVHLRVGFRHSSTHGDHVSSQEICTSLFAGLLQNEINRSVCSEDKHVASRRQVDRWKSGRDYSKRWGGWGGAWQEVKENQNSC